MNGRVYDYNLGRFLSVDPFIQEPGNSQSINPYSYIMNNPLAGTDPTGYVSENIKRKDIMEAPTGSRIKRKTGTKVTGTVKSGGVTTKFSATISNGSVKGSQTSSAGGQSVSSNFAGNIGSEGSKANGGNAPSTSGVGGALISKHAYGGGGELPDGISQVSSEQLETLKLDGLAFSDSDSGFQSSLYYDSNNKSYIYAFAGTNGDGDMAANFAQGAGKFATQYDLALSNTKAIRSAVGGNLYLTGHSLGGGLAGMAAALTGLSANTYNAAGVHMSGSVPY
jgi:hypothetical protein